ncbi:MAG: hypothetical protein LBB67_07840, partial [Oscillospiraceae bacterium]|nr:hypothetical protein [Oscillospiraceae bacterium]
MKLYVIHHSHTDIGYTDRQERIEWDHVKYLERVVDILREAYDNGNVRWQGFKWTCEGFWAVEKFLRLSTDAYIKDFSRFVKSGNIGVSGNYLNCTELVNDTVLRETMAGVAETARVHEMDISCGMTADINGYGWGYASALADYGVENLLSCVHTHHGFYTAHKKQYPFFWEAKDGNRVLVWQGEHYNIGNELYLHRIHRRVSNMIRDDLADRDMEDGMFSETRIRAYIKKLKEDGYPFDFLPITVSGLMADNAPPNPMIMEFIYDWNEKHGDDIQMEMATLKDFFAVARAHADQIACYAGDWTDWWSDGVGSTPDVVKHYREAVAKYNLCRKLDPDRKVLDQALMDTARYNLMMYAEHTWGYFSSVTIPYDPMVDKLDKRKASFALNADEAVSRCLDTLCESKGMTTVVPGNKRVFHAVNPNAYPIAALVKFDLEWHLKAKETNLEIIDCVTDEAVPFQIIDGAKREIHIVSKLRANEHRRYSLRGMPEPPPVSIGLCAPYGVER